LALVILIGLELLKVLKIFLIEDKIKPELVVEVAIIALCNKIITLDMKHTSSDVLLGIAAILVGLSIGYFFFASGRRTKKRIKKCPTRKNQTAKVKHKIRQENSEFMLNDFKAFIARGNILDLAIAVIMGAAFGAIVKTLPTELLCRLSVF